MSAWEGSSFQEASEQERARKKERLAKERSAAPAHLRGALRGLDRMFGMFGAAFPRGVEVQLRVVAGEEGFTFESEEIANTDYISVTCQRREIQTCRWCGKTRDEHREPTLGSPIARMPCLGLKSGFAAKEGK